MAAVSSEGTKPPQVFRSRAVLVAGLADLIAGGGIVCAGAGLAAWWGNRDALPLGLAISVVGLLLLLSGLGRVTARLEVDTTRVAWTWACSRQEVALADLEDAELVEKGSPASGASWAGVLGGGFLSAVVWWLVGLFAAFVGSEPGLGSYDLVVIKRYGAPLEVKPISAWSTHSSNSQAMEAVRAVKAAINGSVHRFPSQPPLPIIRSDAWDSPSDDRAITPDCRLRGGGSEVNPDAATRPGV